MTVAVTSGYIQPEEGVCDLCNTDGKVYWIKGTDERLCKECILTTTDEPDPMAEEPCPIFEECKKYKTTKQLKKEKRDGKA